MLAVAEFIGSKCTTKIRISIYIELKFALKKCYKNRHFLTINFNTLALRLDQHHAPTNKGKVRILLFADDKNCVLNGRSGNFTTTKR